MNQYCKDILKCVKCGRCRTVCPSQKVLGWESSGPRGRILMSHGLLCGLELSRKMIDGLLTCTTCSQCVVECPSGVDPMEITRVAREKLVDMGHMVSHQIEMENRINGTGNSLGEKLTRTSWLKNPAISDQYEYIYFVGCLTSYRRKVTASTTYDLLKRFGVGLMKDEQCCGSPLYRLGLDASEMIEHNSRQIKETGAIAVITECAGCYAMFNEKYPVNSIHLSEFLATRLDQLLLSRLDITVTYHDPCHLGRLHQLYDTPRTLIKQICTLVEMKDSKKNANCCGGGGGVRMGHPEVSHSIANELSDNIPENVDYVVTACPLCIRNLSDVGVPVIDLADLVHLSLD